MSTPPTTGTPLPHLENQISREVPIHTPLPPSPPPLSYTPSLPASTDLGFELHSLLEETLSTFQTIINHPSQSDSTLRWFKSSSDNLKSFQRLYLSLSSNLAILQVYHKAAQKALLSPSTAQKKEVPTP